MTNHQSDDPLLVGLSGLGPETGDQSPYSRPAIEEPDTDSVMDEVSSSVLAGIAQQRAPIETQVPDTPTPTLNESAPNVSGLAIPERSVLSDSGEPFTSYEAAAHKAAVISKESSLEFHVRAIAQNAFVVFPQNMSGSERSQSEGQGSQATGRGYRDLDINEVQLSDFPEEHPVHKSGLAHYKRYFKKNFKFKPAYRSMFLLIAMVPVGLLMYFLPNATLQLLPAESVAQMVATFPIEKIASGVSVGGMVLALVASLRVFWIRQVNRYTLKPNYVEYAEGILFRKTSKIPYVNILNHECNQNPIQLFLNYGTLELASAASDGAEILIRNIYSPRLVEAILEDNIMKSSRARN